MIIMFITWKLEFYSVEGGDLKTEHTQNRHLTGQMTKTVSTEFFIFPDSVPCINFKIY